MAFFPGLRSGRMPVAAGLATVVAMAFGGNGRAQAVHPDGHWEFSFGAEAPIWPGDSLAETVCDDASCTDVVLAVDAAGRISGSARYRAEEISMNCGLGGGISRALGSSITAVDLDMKCKGKVQRVPFRANANAGCEVDASDSFFSCALFVKVCVRNRCASTSEYLGGEYLDPAEAEWHLSLDVASTARAAAAEAGRWKKKRKKDPNNLFGTATVTLSNGRSHDYNVVGRHDETTEQSSLALSQPQPKRRRNKKKGGVSELTLSDFVIGSPGGPGYRLEYRVDGQQGIVESAPAPALAPGPLEQ